MNPTKEELNSWYNHKSNKEIWIDQQVEKEMEEEREGADTKHDKGE